MNRNQVAALGITRRHFFRRVRRRRGQDRAGNAAGRNQLAGTRVRRSRRAGKPARLQETALRAQSEAGDPSLHGRSAQPARPLRLQAGSGASGRAAAAALGDRGASVMPSSGPMPPCSARSSSSRSDTENAAHRSRRCCRIWRTSSMTFASSNRHTPGSIQSCPRPDLLEYGLFPAGPAGPGVVRSCTGWDPSRMNLPAFGCDVDGKRNLEPVRPTGRAGSCRRCTPGVRLH